MISPVDCAVTPDQVEIEIGKRRFGVFFYLKFLTNIRFYLILIFFMLTRYSQSDENVGKGVLDKRVAHRLNCASEELWLSVD